MQSWSMICPPCSLQVIRRPKVEYQSSKDSFELTICSTDDVESIKKKVEAQHGLPADSHTLLWKGKRLSASKSLASYGVGGGSVLELVPIEPLDAGEVPSGSPLLSSPQHELVACFQDLLLKTTRQSSVMKLLTMLEVARC